jgi:hypothetical protein
MVKARLAPVACECTDTDTDVLIEAVITRFVHKDGCVLAEDEFVRSEGFREQFTFTVPATICE